MNIIRLLTKTNIQIIRIIDKESMHIRDIADELRISPGTVHKLISLLKANNMASETRKKNRSIISLNKENAMIKEIKRLINLNDFMNTKAYDKLKKTGRIGIYGSYANGTNDNESDLDIWIRTEKKEMELRPIIRAMEQEMKTRINPLILTEQKLSQLKRNDPEFYTRLILTSIGEKID